MSKRRCFFITMGLSASIVLMVMLAWPKGGFRYPGNADQYLEVFLTMHFVPGLYAWKRCESMASLDYGAPTIALVGIVLLFWLVEGAPIDIAAFYDLHALAAQAILAWGLRRRWR